MSEWRVTSRVFDLEWDYCNPEWDYKRVLHLRIGRIIFSMGWKG